MTYKLGKLPKTIAAVRTMLAATKPAIDHLAALPWHPDEGYFDAVRRAAVCRQHEAMEAALLLVEAGKGECAAPLLRPACEELLWFEYLTTLARDDAQLILVCIAHHEKWQSLCGQLAISGEEVMRRLALTAHHQQSLVDYPLLKSEFKRLGRKLDWPKRAIKEGET